MKGAKKGSKRQAHDTWVVKRTLTPQANVVCNIMSADKTRENVTYEGALFTHTVGCGSLLLVVNDPTTTISENMTSTNFFIPNPP